MSFEGFYQKWCSHGHYYEDDVYSGMNEEICPVCKTTWIVKNLVDDTNVDRENFIEPRVYCMDKGGELIYHVPGEPELILIDDKDIKEIL
jgi:hypothetical protein